jgi:hypothetical protein
VTYTSRPPSRPAAFGHLQSPVRICRERSTAWGAQTRSRCDFVLVEYSSEEVAPLDVWRSKRRCRRRVASDLGVRRSQVECSARLRARPPALGRRAHALLAPSAPPAPAPLRTPRRHPRSLRRDRLQPDLPQSPSGIILIDALSLCASRAALKRVGLCRRREVFRLGSVLRLRLEYSSKPACLGVTASSVVSRRRWRLQAGLCWRSFWRRAPQGYRAFRAPPYGRSRPAVSCSPGCPAGTVRV